MSEKGRDRINALISGDEYDVFSIWRRISVRLSRAGVVAKTKRRFNKRTRQKAKQIVSKEADELN